jgi:DNA/RNA endonuclease G (NUC1)
MIDAGLSFEGPVRRASGPWDAFWAQAERETILSPVTGSVTGGNRNGSSNNDAAGTAALVISPADTSAGARITIPLHIDITLDVSSGAAAGAAPLASSAPIEKMVEPIHDPIELSRAGYQPDFIGTDVPPPRPRRIEECVVLEDGSTELKYHHYSVVMNRARRIALFTASNVDGSKAAKEPEPGHRYTRAGLTGLGDGDVEKWYTDPRIRGTEQLPDRFFNKDRKAFDKGHLVRREDVAWGKTFAEVQAANGDTYFVTNCSPQVAGFNRSNRRDNWGALEDLVLKQAASERYCLFAGPVLKDDDPLFAGVDDLGATKVRIPRKYWKVVVANSSDGLKLFAFVLDQDLSDVAMEFAVPASWVPHMVRLSELEEELGSLDFAEELHAADQFDSASALGSTALIESVAGQIAAMEPASTETLEAVAGHGRFIGLPAQVAFSEIDRSANLLAPLSYVDPAETNWSVPVGAWLDGASIPQPFWSIIGGPFEGRYREASIVHDHYCIVRSRPWRDTHRMFFEGMLCRGVSSFKARIMYYAVYRFGPRWGERNTEGVAELPPVPEPLTDASATSILDDARTLASENLDIEAIERLADRHSRSTDTVEGAASGRDKYAPSG